MTKPFPLALGAALLTLGLGACGGSSSSSASPATSSSAAAAPPARTATASPTGPTSTEQLTIAANPGGQLKFTKTSLAAHAGKVTVAFANNAPEAHNLMIQQGNGGPIVGAIPTFQGGSKTLTVTLKPGTYTFFCGVPGHREGGMQGILTVQ